MPFDGTRTVEGVCLSAFSYEGNLQTEAFKDKRLALIDGNYLIITLVADTKSPSKIPTGWWDFVISVETPKVLHVRRSRLQGAESRANDKYKLDLVKRKEKMTSLAGRGHSSIAQGRAVLFAGTIFFGGDMVVSPKVNPGELIRWTNQSGHYKVGLNLRGAELDRLIAAQTSTVVDSAGGRMLPMDKFQPWDGDM
jgi:hypothetical protein